MFVIEFSKKSEKDLKKLDRVVTERILSKIRTLTREPFPRDSIKLKGEENVFRIRIGKYRVLYEIYHETQ